VEEVGYPNELVRAVAVQEVLKSQMKRSSIDNFQKSLHVCVTTHQKIWM
jgi:hypothetical protein